MHVILSLLLIALSRISIQSDLNVIIYVDDYLKEVRVNSIKRDVSFKTGTCEQSSFIVKDFYPGDMISFVIDNGVSYCGISALLSINNINYSTENSDLWHNLKDNFKECDKISKETIWHFTLLPADIFLSTPEDNDEFSFIFPIDLQCTDANFFPSINSIYTIDMSTVIKPVIEDAPYNQISIIFDASDYLSTLSSNNEVIVKGHFYTLEEIQILKFNPSGQTWKGKSFVFYSMATNNIGIQCQINIYLCENDKDNDSGKCIQCKNDDKRLMEINGILQCVSWDEDKGKDNYFLDIDDIVKPCYSTCLKCSGSGNSDNHKCIECIPNYSMKIDEEGNCYENSSLMDYYYYKDNLFRKCYFLCKKCK